MKKIPLLILFIILPASLNAETIQLKSGWSIDAKIIERTDDHIKIDFKGMPITYYLDEIESILSDDEKEKTPLSSPPSESAAPASSKRPLAPIPEQVTATAAQSIVVVMTERDNRPYLYGTGFFISKDGLIATNFHVILNADKIQIKTKQGTTYPVERIIRCDDKQDVCVLKSAVQNSPALPIADSNDIFPGQMIFTIGHPLGREYEVTEGQYLTWQLFDGTAMLMTTLDTEVGNSGAPIMDKEGRVIGICVLSGKKVQGYNFGIPINSVKEQFKNDQGLSVKEFKSLFDRAFELTYEGKGALLAEEYGEAENYFKQALGIDPDYLEAYIGLGKAYDALGKAEGAFFAWEEVLNIDPQHVGALSFLGRSYLDRHVFDEAIVYLEKAISLGSRSPHVYNDLGIAYGNKGRLGKAIEIYKQAVAIDPYYANGYYNLAAAYYNKGDREAARENCQKAVRLGHDVPPRFLRSLGIK